MAIDTGPTGLPPSSESAYSWLVLGASLVIASLSFGAVTTVPILMQPMAQDLGWSRATLGLAHSLAMISAGLGGVLMGRLADHHGFGVLALAAAVSIGAGLTLAGHAHHPWHLYLPYAVLVGGIGQGLFFGPITANVTRWFDRNRALAMAGVMCGQSLGGLLVPVILRSAAESWGWRRAMAGYGLAAAAGIALCALALLRRPPLAPDAHRAAGRPRISHSARRTFVATCAILVPLNATAFMVIAHLVPYCEEQGLPPTASAMPLALLLGVTLVSRLLGGVLLDRGRISSVILPCAMLMPLGALTLLYSGGAFPALLTGAALFGMGYGGIFPVFTHLIRSQVPAAVAGTWISAMFLTGFLAAATGSWLAGYLRDLSGSYQLPLMAATLLGTTGLINALLLPYRERLAGIRQRLSGLLSARPPREDAGR